MSGSYPFNPVSTEFINSAAFGVVLSEQNGYRLAFHGLLPILRFPNLDFGFVFLAGEGIVEAVTDVVGRGFSGAHPFVQQFAGGGSSVFIEQARAYGFDPELIDENGKNTIPEAGPKDQESDFGPWRTAFKQGGMVKRTKPQVAHGDGRGSLSQVLVLVG